ncbi:flagellin [Lentibacillus sp. Marseille-P4043]|uniref:flagellin n=1 Tax=Lentibacillus sp. Marseille-P4043 TaxID=2040293 RepID=UPI0022775C2C|nr:flagellin [Lentibacillus sp. Marseille-P4043]
MDTAIQKATSERSRFGAYQNALEHINNNVSNYKMNLTAAESQLRDLDMAKEITKLANKQVLLQSSQAMLSQANQIPQSLLQFLK